MTPAAWMTDLPDDVALTALTIPGTHQSCARYAGPTLGFLRCQNRAFTLDRQLATGIRYLDIRLRAHRQDLLVHHESVFQHETFGGVLTVCGEFLARHPGEMILMRIRQEHSTVAPETFRDALAGAAAAHRHGWRLRWDDGLPTLGAARGRITLISGPPCVGGIAWKGALMDVQDDYEVTSLAVKTGVVIAHLHRAADARPGDTRPLLVNHTSGYRFPQLSPRRIARQVNPQVARVMAELPEQADRGGLGVIAMDYADEFAELIERLITWNRPSWTATQAETPPASSQANAEGAELGTDRTEPRSARSTRTTT